MGALDFLLRQKHQSQCSHTLVTCDLLYTTKRAGRGQYFLTGVLDPQSGEQTEQFQVLL